MVLRRSLPLSVLARHSIFGLSPVRMIFLWSIISLTGQSADTVPGVRADENARPNISGSGEADRRIFRPG
jgi:hypothetical protein